MIGSSDSGESRHKRGIPPDLYPLTPIIRMKDSRVLVLNMTGAITELCRHLVLSGINLELADDKVLVESSMAQSEFLINPDEDAGKPVSDAF